MTLFEMVNSGLTPTNEEMEIIEGTKRLEKGSDVHITERMPDNVLSAHLQYLYDYRKRIDESIRQVENELAQRRPERHADYITIIDDQIMPFTGEIFTGFDKPVGS